MAQPPGLEPVELGRQAASQYDPEGDDGEESPEAENLVLDGLRNTGWDTETYQAGFEGAGKSGVGIYVDAGEPIPGRRLALITSTPDPQFKAGVYAANTIPTALRGWTKVSGVRTVNRERAAFRLELPRNQRFQYYLVWISSLPESGKATIQEIRLSRQG